MAGAANSKAAPAATPPAMAPVALFPPVLHLVNSNSTIEKLAQNQIHPEKSSKTVNK